MYVDNPNATTCKFICTKQNKDIQLISLRQRGNEIIKRTLNLKELRKKSKKKKRTNEINNKIK